MKNLLKLAMMAGLLSGAACADSKQDASEAVTRFEGVKKVFAEKGIGAIAFLNGTGSLASGTGKGRENENIGLEVGVDNFNDPDAPLICVGADDTYIVHTGQTSLVGTSAVTGENIFRDGVGTAMVAKAREALSRGTPKGLTTIDFVQNSRMPNPREGQPSADNDYLAVADSRFIKGLPEGAICMTKAENFEPRDNSDLDRKAGPDGGAYPREKVGHDGKDVPHHGHKHHKHHAKAKADVKEAKDTAKEAKADAKEAKDAAKEAKADVKEAKDAAKEAKADAKDAKDTADKAEVKADAAVAAK